MSDSNRAEATEHLRSKGFDVETASPLALRDVTPWAFPWPSGDILLARGRVDDAETLVVDYRSTTGAAGATAAADRGGMSGGAASSWHTVVVMRHPRIIGRVVFYPDPPGWSKLSRAIDIASWIPPFVVLRGAAWVLSRLAGFEDAEDCEIGDAEFDRLFRVHAATDETAAESIPAPLREFVLASKRPVTVEIREGEVRFALPRERFDGAHVDDALRFASGLLQGCVASRGAPMR